MRSTVIKVLTFMISVFTVSAFAQEQNSPHRGSIQDPKKAVEYFDKELAFITGPHNVNQVVTGEVKNVTIVDVRSAKDYKEGHIPGAINIPTEKYNNFAGNETEFPGLRKNGYNYVYCYDVLCNLAQKAARKFAMAGYPVKEVRGGFEGWQEGGYPIEK